MTDAYKILQTMVENAQQICVKYTTKNNFQKSRLKKLMHFHIVHQKSFWGSRNNFQENFCVAIIRSSFSGNLILMCKLKINPF